MLEIAIVLVVVAAAAYMIGKKLNPTIVLFTLGTVLLLVAALLGHGPDGKLEFDSTGNAFFDVFAFVGAVISNRLAEVGLTIMVLFGFSTYMTRIGANDVAVHVLTRPLRKIRATYLLVPLTFLLGNVLSLVVPSASSLGILLMATLYPTLVGVGLSRLTAGAVIATTATIVPTPLGADNIVAAKSLGVGLLDYTYGMHAKVSVPTLLVIAVVHYFWQKYMDARARAAGAGPAPTADTLEDERLDIRTDLPPSWYAVFPLLPLLMVVALKVGAGLDTGLVPITLACLLITLAVELLRRRQVAASFEDARQFYEGMAAGLKTTVALLIGAALLVEGITRMGVLAQLIDAVKNAHGAGFILMICFAGAELLMTLITGSGMSVFYAVSGALGEVSRQAHLNGALLALPMQFMGNLTRAMSPISAVVIIVASVLKVAPTELVKRTAVPMGAGILVSLTLTWLLIPH
ncbi:C4-dicarboxylate ABC transporter [Streptomyces sp. NRRL F-4489]|uniref:C4-dicarboxylate transporter DcuC n=1 Tax=Streptomyces sp. NRRL F-4489 TaxID=1609095 RepID=UPI0007461EFE|nr:C4-dicarboxylate transporter DcuC [Streptomyces sp. NRRL F-4489]KUL38603.1 C4-dicarboxylate ABC transporter [Streptomyces sp. NRRL F-4489]